jgi:hypothetical protein
MADLASYPEGRDLRGRHMGIAPHPLTGDQAAVWLIGVVDGRDKPWPRV